MEEKKKFSKVKAIDLVIRLLQVKPDLLPQHQPGKMAAQQIIDFTETLAPYIVTED